MKMNVDQLLGAASELNLVLGQCGFFVSITHYLDVQLLKPLYYVSIKMTSLSHILKFHGFASPNATVWPSVRKNV